MRGGGDSRGSTSPSSGLVLCGRGGGDACVQGAGGSCAPASCALASQCSDAQLPKRLRMTLARQPLRKAHDSAQGARQASLLAQGLCQPLQCGPQGLSVWPQQPVRCTGIALRTPPCPAPEEAVLQRWPRQRRQASGKPPAVDAVASLATAAAQTAAAAGARHACGCQGLPRGCSVTLDLTRAGWRDFGTRQRSRVRQGTGHGRARPPRAARRLPGQALWTTHPRLAGRLPC